MSRGRRGIAALALLLAGILMAPAMAVDTSASSAVLMEQESGRVLYAQNMDEERSIASITKIMTAVVALEQGDLRWQYTVTAEDMAEGSSMYLKPGDTLELEELLYGLMLPSGNDAALAIAHCVSGDVDTFVGEMNHMAERLGMTHSHFANPNGLDAEGHYASARDMAVLASYALHHQDFRRIVSTASVTIGDRYMANHNKLLRLYPGCIGVKTGFTKKAGRTLVSAVQRDNMTLVCVTLNDGDDWNDHMHLFDYGFNAYRMETVLHSGQIVGRLQVRGGTADTIPLAVDADLRYPLTGKETLFVKIKVPYSVAAPVVPGQVVGTAAAYLEGVNVAEVNLIAAAPSAKAEEKEESLWHRLFGGK